MSDGVPFGFVVNGCEVLLAGAVNRYWSSGHMKRLLIISGIVVLLGATLVLLREPILLAVGGFLVVQDQLYPADAVHVISGPDHRTDYAIHLYHQGYAGQIFFTGGWCPTHGYHGERGRSRAVEQGVPREATAIDDSPVTSTYSETVRLKEWIAANQGSIRSVIVVSDPYHMRRARWTYRHVLGDGIEVQMAPVPFELSPYERRWWADEESRLFVRNEYLKLAYYYARYGLGWGVVGEWLAFLDRY